MKVSTAPAITKTRKLKSSTKRKQAKVVLLEKLEVADTSINSVQMNEEAATSWSQLMEHLVDQNYEPFNEKLLIDSSLDEENFGINDFKVSNESIDFLMLVGKSNELDLRVIGTSQLPVPFLFHTSNLYFNIDSAAKQFKCNFELFEFSAGEYMFLGQLGFYYNVYLMFTPINDQESLKTFIHPKFMSKMDMDVVQKLFSDSLKEMCKTKGLPNGIIVSENYSNLYDESSWEFDIASLHGLSDIVSGKYVKFQEQELFSSFFKHRQVRVVLSKYGQNIGCTPDNMDALIRQMGTWFNFSRCDKVCIAYAKNYCCIPKDNPHCILFKRKELDDYLGQSTDFYGKAFSSKVGNFQVSKIPKRVQEGLHEYEEFIRQELSDLPKNTFTFHGMQGYSSIKSVLRRRSWEEPFYQGNITSSLTINTEQASKKQLKDLRETYDTQEFDEARSNSISYS